MERLNEILHELGISKVKLAKFLGVSRQMIYNYLDLDDINKWPKDKKVLLLNLLGIKSPDELNSIKVDTDYIMSVETRINSLFEKEQVIDYSDSNIYSGLGKKQKEVLYNIINLAKEKLEDDKDQEAYETFKYLYHFLQAMDSSKELKYILAYVSKSIGQTPPLEFAFEQEEQFKLEGVLFSALTLYQAKTASPARIAESHKRFIKQIEQKLEEKLGRTLELNLIKVQALKELGYTTINDINVSEVFEKMAEIESRKIND